MATTKTARSMPAESPASRLEVVDIARLVTEHGFNNRQDLGDLAELVDSIKSLGLLQPLIVRSGIAVKVDPPESALYVVAGHRRLEACRLAGLKQVPVLVRELDEVDRLEVLLVENLHRKDITALEEAEGFRRLVDLGLSQREVAAKVGRAQSHVSKRLSLLQLPESVREKVAGGELAVEHALELTRLVNHPEELARVAENGIRNPSTLGWSVEQSLLEIKNREARQAAITELDAAGVKAIVAKNSWDEPSYNRGLHPVEYLEEKVRKGHAKLSCHAVFVTWLGVKIPVCTDEASHYPGRKKGEAKEKAPVKPAWQVEREKREHLRETRLPALKRLVASKLGAAERDFVIAMTPFLMNEDNRLSVLLDFDVDADDVDEEAKALEAYLAGGADRALRAAYAAALGEKVFGYALDQGGLGARIWLRHASERGIELTDDERAFLGESEPKSEPIPAGAAAAIEEAFPGTFNLNVDGELLGGEQTTIEDFAGDPAVDIAEQARQAARELEATPLATVADPLACVICGQRKTEWADIDIESGHKTCSDCFAAVPVIAGGAPEPVKPARRKSPRMDVCRVCGKTRKQGAVMVEMVDAGARCSECA